MRITHGKDSDCLEAKASRHNIRRVLDAEKRKHHLLYCGRLIRSQQSDEIQIPPSFEYPPCPAFHHAPLFLGLRWVRRSAYPGQRRWSWCLCFTGVDFRTWPTLLKLIVMNLKTDKSGIRTEVIELCLTLDNVVLLLAELSDSDHSPATRYADTDMPSVHIAVWYVPCRSERELPDIDLFSGSSQRPRSLSRGTSVPGATRPSYSDGRFGGRSYTTIGVLFKSRICCRLGIFLHCWHRNSCHLPDYEGKRVMATPKRIVTGRRFSI